ncbi:MAG: peroxiredoxin family protein [Pirellula sp.]|jgi:peroxiredoxin|nr:peroxiredoxin family protein [Pirellula sp.]
MFRFVVCIAFLFVSSTPILAADDHADSSKVGSSSQVGSGGHVDSGPSPGHSMHGESFNEGPRQAAYLMQGMGNVHFPITSKNPLAQRFFDQGISQLHGFWYFEAERSFRQAASLDAEHPMPYWGMARANIENEQRSAGFIQQAIQRIDRASDKERRLIEAWHERVKQPTKKKSASEANANGDAAADGDVAADGDKSTESDDEGQKDKEDRLKKYLGDLDSIAVDYPDDVEIKAMIVLQAWQNNGEGNPIQSFTSMNSLLAEIFRTNPMHPAHHFRIHLWDYKKEELAVQSAALCGLSAPGIAHMWHMPGHTYSRLKRFSDAAWQQEASARVDHAHMMRDRVMPDQIHNYAHNNEWLVRSLMLIGQPTRAISLAKNMIELPRHPKYNTFENHGSSLYGRERLLQAVVQYERWEELLLATDTHYLPEESDALRNDERLAWRSIAADYLGKSEIAQEAKAKIETARRELEDEESKKLELIEQFKKETPSNEAATAESATAESATNESATNESGANEAAAAESGANGVATNETGTAEPATAEVPPEAPEPTAPPAAPLTAIELFGKPDDPALPKELEKDWKLPDGDDAKSWSEDRREAERALHSLRYRKQRLSYWIAAVESHQSANQGDFREALRHSHAARPVVSEWTRLEWLVRSGDPAEAWKMAETKLNDSPGEFLPLVRGAWFLSQLTDKTEQLQGLIEKHKPLAANSEPGIKHLDRLKGILAEKGIVVDWNAPGQSSPGQSAPGQSSPGQPVSDVGERPDLDSLGPFRWAPSNAPMWRAVTARGDAVTSKQYAGRPYIAVLYLGSGCLHCVEQLTKLSPRSQEFKSLGIDLVAISTENVAQLSQGIASFGKPIDMLLLSNVEQDTFRGFRAYDDFEGQPLHGTFLVDSDGKVLWQDIGHEPFMDIDFLLEESERLLGLGGPSR